MTKYFSKRTGSHASKKESARSFILHQMAKDGLITDLEEQVKYELVPKQKGERAVTYTADFRYKDNGVLVVEDSKGFRTQQYVIRRKLMLHVHGIRVLET